MESEWKMYCNLTRFKNDENKVELEDTIINLLCDRKYSIAETRGLFENIVKRLELCMPISNNVGRDI